MIHWYTTVLLLFLAGCNGLSGNPYHKVMPHAGNAYKVTGVKDGDTFVVLMDGSEQVVRLAHIDCPEKKQPFGSRAKQFVSDRCFGKYVLLLHHYKYDRNKRLIAEVMLEDGSNLNQELVRNGLAWHFKKYSTDAGYAALEAAARLHRKGLWADEKPVAPWEWRHR
ncbi:MAG: thermonuclease family protein [Niabella sp.]|nr:thermonuclease family protein [Niabella sp.]